MSVNDFKKMVGSIFKSQKDEVEIIDQIITSVKDETEENLVVFEKLNNLIEVY